MTATRRAVLLAAATIATGCTPTVPPPASNTVDGTLTYRERIALTPANEVVVRIVATRQVTGERDVIVQSRLPSERQVPIPFSLIYDPARVQAGSAVWLEAEISRDGRPWFAAPPQPLDTAAGFSRLDVLLRIVGT